MQFLWILAFHQCFSVASGLSARNSSLINANLHQCDTNTTFTNRTIALSDPLFRSCNFNCCLRNRSNDTRYSDICQVTVLSSNGACTSRLCYFGGCTTFINVTSNPAMVSSTAVLAQIRSPLPGPTLTNSTGINWILWKKANYSSIRSSALVLLLVTNILLTVLTAIVIIRSIKHARVLADKKSRRYSLF